MSPQETLAMRHRARKSAGRFTDLVFAEKWLANMEKLVALQVDRSKK
jgi:alpha-1,2-mannosyltransferase